MRNKLILAIPFLALLAGSASAEEYSLSEPIFFKQDRRRVRSAFRPALQQLAEYLKRHPEIHAVEVIGHADANGTKEWNEELAQRRADAVVDYLVAHGVERERLLPLSHGCDMPLADNDSDHGRDQNRRVVFRIVEVDQELARR